MNKTDLAYIAGIIDGEGCIGFSRRKSKAKGEDYYNYHIRVDVGNTNRWLLEYLRFNFGGSISKGTRTSKNYKEVRHWRLSAKSAGEFLGLILPYLKLKRMQAEMALKFQTRRQSKSRKKLTTGEQALDEAEAILANSYNQRGIPTKGL